MNESLSKWLENELQDFEPVWQKFRNKQQKMYYIWMAVAIVGMVALGFGVGYDWKYVLRMHFPIGLGIALFIWLCVALTNKVNTMKNVRKRFESALSALPQSEQEAFSEQSFERADFLNTLDDGTPCRLLIGQDFWLYFRGACHIYRVDDIEKLRVHEEKTRLNYNVGSKSVHQKVGIGVSIQIDYYKDSVSAKESSDQVYLASWEQLKTAKELIESNCPKAAALWVE